MLVESIKHARLHTLQDKSWFSQEALLLSRSSLPEPGSLKASSKGAQLCRLPGPLNPVYLKMNSLVWFHCPH